MSSYSNSKKIRLGILVITSLFFLVLAIYLIGSKQKLFGKSNHLVAVFKYASGLQTGNNVRYSGVNVGNVRTIKMHNDTTIVVDMLIDQEIFSFIKKDAFATISSDGLVGNMIINILPGKDGKAFVSNGDTIATYSKIQTDDLLKTFSVTNENVVLLTSDLLKITKEITEGKGTISTFLNDSIFAKDIRESIRNIKYSTEKIHQSVKEVNAITNDLSNNPTIDLIQDSLLAIKIKSVIVKSELAVEQLNKTIYNTEEAIENIKNGDGILKYATQNKEVVYEIDSIIHNLNRASKGLDENMQALKHNFLFRGYFKKVEKEKRKK